MIARSSLPETRNPVLRLPSAQRIRQLPAAQKDMLASLLGDLSRDARERAEHSWRKHKAPMAAYWKAVAVYARHARLALRVGAPR